MTEMDAFERLVADEMMRRAGPVRHVDDFAVFDRVRVESKSRSGGFTVFSALKFAAAGVIVALFGGFLFTGILSTRQGDVAPPAAVTGSPTPMTTEQFLSTMITEEVAPGVLRVVNDGYRDLAHLSSGYPWDCERVLVGDSHHVWRAIPPCWQVYRLGHEGAWDFDRERVALGWGQGFASRDGRLWSLGSAGLTADAPYDLRLFGDGAWVPDPRLLEPSHGQIHVDDDGTLWLLEGDAIHWVADTSVEGQASAGSSSWADVWAGADDRDGPSLLRVTDDGVAWLMTERGEDGRVSFLRFDGADWGVVPGPEGFNGASAVVGPFSAGVSPKGTLWTAGDSLAPHLSLARLDDDGWTTFTAADGVQPWGGQRYVWGTRMDTLWVAPDGSAWVNASVPDIRADGTLGCDGLARFDGDSWQPFLAGHCIADLDFAPDGSAWVVARDPQRFQVHTYVITPAATHRPAAATRTEVTTS